MTTFDQIGLPPTPKKGTIAFPGHPNIVKEETVSCGFCTGTFVKEEDGTISFVTTKKRYMTAEDVAAYVSKQTQIAEDIQGEATAAEAKLTIINNL